MTDDQNPPVRIPESADDAVAMVEEDEDEEAVDEQRRNLIRAQYRLIDGDPE